MQSNHQAAVAARASIAGREELATPSARVSGASRATALTHPRGRTRDAEQVWARGRALALQLAVSMPGTSYPSAEPRVVADAARFDLSDVDEVDIGSSGPLPGEPRPIARDRADHADAVLAMCALLVFQHRARRARHGARRVTLPGL